jgi:hypothetical protein
MRDIPFSFAPKHLIYFKGRRGNKLGADARYNYIHRYWD